MLKQKAKQVAEMKANKRSAIFVAVACFALVLAAMIFFRLMKCGERDSCANEMFLKVDFHRMAEESIRLPFIHEMRGEHSIVKIVLNRLDRIYHYDNSIFVVLEGPAELYEIENNVLLETFTAALRFSLKPCCINSAITFDGDPVLGKLSVYSTNKDVEAIVERRGGACWKAFCSTISRWKMPLQSMPFAPARRIQLEADGVFVFEEKP